MTDIHRLSWEWYKQVSSEWNSGMHNWGKWHVSKQRKAFITASGGPQHPACLCSILIPWWQTVSTVEITRCYDRSLVVELAKKRYTYSRAAVRKSAQNIHTHASSWKLCLETQRNEMLIKHAWCELQNQVPAGHHSGCRVFNGYWILKADAVNNAVERELQTGMLGNSCFNWMQLC